MVIKKNYIKMGGRKLRLLVGGLALPEGVPKILSQSKSKAKVFKPSLVIRRGFQHTFSMIIVTLQLIT